MEKILPLSLARVTVKTSIIMVMICVLNACGKTDSKPAPPPSVQHVAEKAAIVDAAVHGHGAPPARQSKAAAHPSARKPREVIALDGGLDEELKSAALRLATRRGARVVVLKDARDPLADLSEALKDDRDVSALHIISHGEEGAIKIAGREINTSDLLASSAQASLATIRHALAEGGEIFLYGCDSGKDQIGKHFVETLARATGAAVAASTNATGAGQSADWKLERATAPMKLAAMALPNWTGRLWTSELWGGGWYSDNSLIVTPETNAANPSMGSLGNQSAGSGTTLTMSLNNNQSVAVLSNVDATSYAQAVANNEYWFSTFTFTGSAPIGLNRITVLPWVPTGNSNGTANTSVGNVQVTLYDPVTQTTFLYGSPLSLNGKPLTAVNMPAPSTLPPLVQGRQYEVRIYTWGCASNYGTFAKACVIDNIILYTATNQPPVATNDTFNVYLSNGYTYPGLNIFTTTGSGADSDPESNAFSITSINGAAAANGSSVQTGTAPTNGTATLTNVNSGLFSFAPTAVGSNKTFTYRVTDTWNNVSNTATVTINVLAARLVATSDSGTVSAATGGTAIANVRSNDTLNGTAIGTNTTSTTLALAPGTSLPSGLTFNTSTGAISVAAGTPGGVYTVKYLICETATAYSCTIGTATVTVNSVTLNVAKTSTVISDPVNGTTNPKLIPGAIVEYSLTFSNASAVATDSNSVVLKDTLPVGIEMDVSGTPVTYTNGTAACGVTVTTGIATSTTDSVDYSSDGTTWAYTPNVGAVYDPSVKAFQVRFGGALAASAGQTTPCTVKFRARIK